MSHIFQMYNKWHIFKTQVYFSNRIQEKRYRKIQEQGMFKIVSIHQVAYRVDIFVITAAGDAAPRGSIKSEGT